MAPSVPEALKKKRVAHQAALAKKALAQQQAKKANVLKRRAICKVIYQSLGLHEIYMYAYSVLPHTLKNMPTRNEF